MSRKDTGKSSIWWMVCKMMAFFMALGSPFIWWFQVNLVPRVGQTSYVNGEVYHATQWDVIKGTLILSLGWATGVGIVIFLGWALMRFICNVLFYNDEQYHQWRAQGGDPYFDSLAEPFNPDDEESRERY